MKLSVVIPCLNEAKTIKNVLQDCTSNVESVLSRDQYEIILVDNGSIDRSVEIASAFKNVRIIKEQKRGYGYALHAGISNAKGEYVLTSDADESYKFLNISRYLESINQKQYDYVLGSRLKGKIEQKAMPFLNRYLGTPILSFLISKLYNMDVSDCNSGMRAIRREFYLNLKITVFNMAWASEMLIKGAKNKVRYKEIPIDFFNDRRGRPSHLSRWQDGLRHLWVVVRNI